MLDPSGISENERSHWTLPPHTHTYKIIIKKTRQNLLCVTSRMRLKAAVPFFMTLTVGGSLNKNTAIVYGPGPPDLIRVCRSCAIPGISVRGWLVASSLSFLSADSAGPSLARQIHLKLTVFLVFFFLLLFFFSYIQFLETKAPIRRAVRRLVWAFAVPMYQRQISRDKVHTIFKNSKLNVKIYTHNDPPPPGVFAEGCIVFAFQSVRSSFPIFVRLLVRS